MGSISPMYDNSILFMPSSKELDISNPQLVDSYFKTNHFDLVLNCSALSNVELCEREQNLAYTLNAYAPGLLAKKCAEMGAKFVHFSTDYVFYDSVLKIPFIETDDINPQTVYGRSKAKGERLVLKANSEALICRTSWLYGSSGRNFVKTISCLARERGKISDRKSVV